MSEIGKDQTEWMQHHRQHEWIDKDYLSGVKNMARLVVDQEITFQQASDLMRNFIADMPEHEILQTQLDMQTTRAVFNEAHDLFIAERLRRLHNPNRWDVV